MNVGVQLQLCLVFSTWKLEGYMDAKYLSNSTDVRVSVDDVSSESIQMVSSTQTSFRGF